MGEKRKYVNEIKKERKKERKKRGIHNQVANNPAKCKRNTE